MECDVVISESAKNSIIAYFEEISSQPRTLSECCRIAIRRSLRTNIPDKTNQLGLPEPMKEFLNLPELDEIDAHARNREESDNEEEILSDSNLTDTSVSGTEMEMSDTDDLSD